MRGSVNLDLTIETKNEQDQQQVLIEDGENQSRSSKIYGGGRSGLKSASMRETESDMSYTNES